MTIGVKANALVQLLNTVSGPGQLAEMMKLIGIGTVIRNLPTYLNCKAPLAAGASPYDGATIGALVLPDDAKAASIIRAYGRTGGVTATELAAQAYAATPTTGQIAVAPSGNIALLGTDAWTNMDVAYIPMKQDPVELVLPCASNAAALPVTTNSQLNAGTGSTGAGGVIMLMEAEILTGTTPGKKIVTQESASTAATGTARLDLAKANVKFASADAATQVRVKLGVACKSQITGVLGTLAAMGSPAQVIPAPPVVQISTPDLDALLEAASTTP